MFHYVSDFLPRQIVVIGAGGTGSRLVPQLAQFIKTVEWVIDPKILVFDDDVVEDKNLVRQNFIRADVGKNKAVVLAERYARAYDVNIRGVPHRFNTETTANLFDQRYYSATFHPIVFICVDSAASRRDILFQLRNTRAFVIDSGNEDSFGQIKLFSMKSGLGEFSLEWMADVPKSIPESILIPYMPYDQEFYENLQDATARSCAELDQTLAINSLMAANMMGAFQQFTYRKPINYHQINIGLDYASFEYMTVPFMLDHFVRHGKGEHAVKRMGLDDPLGDTVFAALEKYRDYTPPVLEAI